MSSVIIYNDDDLHIARNAARKVVERAKKMVDEAEPAYFAALKRKQNAGIFCGIERATQAYWAAIVELEQSTLIYQQYSGANHDQSNRI